MRWPGWSGKSDKTSEDPKLPPAPPPRAPISWNDSLNGIDWQHYREPRNWVPSAIAAVTLISAWGFYKSYLRRIPGVDHIRPSAFRRRSIFGQVTSVGDGDNFHLFHTPGGRLAGWGWLRKVPTDRKELKGRTISVRIAGVDAPEGAHFGRPAQPYSAEALSFLQSYVLGRRVRAYIHKRDQYERVVATVRVRRLWGLLRRDVGLAMLKRGLATTYEAKTGAEFGGLEAKYRATEEKARRARKGLWSGQRWGGKVETPREYKARYASEGKTGPPGSGNGAL